MRYITVPEIEQYEENVLPAIFNKHFQPSGSLSIDRDTIIEMKGVQFKNFEDSILAINPQSAAWAFLTEEESNTSKRLFQEKDSIGHIIDSNSNEMNIRLTPFITQLYKRGLLTLNGMESIDPTVFEDSPNNFDGNLVELLLTEKCNLNCGYCLAGTNPNMPSMSDETAIASIDKAFAMNQAENITFEFSGGEPFLKFELLQKVTKYINERAKGSGKKVYIGAQTNATLLNESRVKWLKENDISIGVSVDGNPESHNISRPTITGRESFTKVIRGIKLLQSYDVPFGILVVLNSSNINSPQSLIDFLKEYDLPILKLNPIAFLGTGRDNWDKVGLKNIDISNYFMNFAKLIVEGDYNIIEENLRTMMLYIMSKQRHSRCMRTHCGAGETFQAINAKGDIYPCGRATQSPGLKLGNVLENPSESFTTTGLRNPFVQDIKKRRPRDFDDCNVCLYQQFCQAGCSVEAYERFGTVRHKTPECDFYKTMYPFIMHWLTFDSKALYHFNKVGYFNSGAQIFSHEYFKT